ncbi:MAG: hypothetical protein MJ093_02875 [Saccharofermentans sp.]|nr:hypothetical protein [Saccharofermentans sp.]
MISEDKTIGLFDRFKKKEKPQPERTVVTGIYLKKEKSTMKKMYGKEAFAQEKLRGKVLATIMRVNFAKVKLTNKNFQRGRRIEKSSDMIYPIPLAINPNILEFGREYYFTMENGFVVKVSPVNGKMKKKPSSYDKQKAKGKDKKKKK